MRQPLQLQILEPCHEKWQEMTPQQQGRFCGSCQKTVVDFSNMADSDLLDYFKNFKGDTCGRFEYSQLQRPLALPPAQKPAWHAWALASLFSFLLFSKAKAQGEVSLKGKVSVKCSGEQVLQEKGTKTAEASQSKPPRIEIKGKIADENGAGIPYASVQVKGEKRGVSADSIGNYAMQLGAKADSVVLVCSAVGFEVAEKNLAVAEAANQRQDISLSLKPYLDEVIVTGYRDELRTHVMGGLSMIRTSIWRKAKEPSTEGLPAPGKAYPNPAKAGSGVHLPFTSAGNFGWRLLTANGNLIFTQPVLPTYAGQVHRFTLPDNIAAGQYFVQIFDADGKISTTTKLMVIH